MNWRTWIGMVMGWLAGAGFLVGAQRPHVVLIMVDDMGYGDAGCYNPESKIPTPHIDRLAAAGMRFTDAHAAGPLCHASRYGLMTGRFPFRTDVSKWPTRPLIDDGQVTVASLLGDAGYQTAMVGKWHLGFEEDGDYTKALRGGPVDRGFASYFGIRASTDIPPYFYIRGDRAVTPPSGRIEAARSDGWSPIQGTFWREGGIAPDLELSGVLPRFTDEAIRVIENRDEEKPLMLYLAYPAPHTPWLPSAEFVGKSGAGMYGDFLMMVDAEIGRVIAALEAAGMLGESLILFTSDNGPVWYPENVERFGHDAVGGLRGMKGDAWEGGHRMPFIVRWPGVVAAGAVCDGLVCSTDVLATLAEAIGKELPQGAGPDSTSFLAALKGEPHERGPVVMQSANGMMMIRSGKWKWIEGLGSGGFSKPGRVKPEKGGPVGQLYDLSTDRGERVNRADDQPEVVERLKFQVSSFKTGD